MYIKMCLQHIILNHSLQYHPTVLYHTAHNVVIYDNKPLNTEYTIENQTTVCQTITIYQTSIQ